MIYQNNFRYGEISRLTSGRFDMEAYSQGAFQFKNAQTMVAGGFKRRPPLKIEGDLYDPETKNQLDEIYKLKQFSLSETISYIIGFAATKAYFFKYDYLSNKIVFVSKNSYPNKPGTEEPITMTKAVASKINTAQYYERMYVVSNSFYPMVIEYTGSSDIFTISTYAFLKNQDGKMLLSSAPSYDDLIAANASEEDAKKFGGKTLYPTYTKDGIKYYINAERTEPYTLYDKKGMEPIQSSSDIENYEVYQDDDFCTAGRPETYPSVVAIINDCLYFAATKNRPQVFWRSRNLGQSQWIEDFSSDSLHDFICFEVVVTDETTLVEDDKLPRKPLDVDGVIQYYQESGNPVWYKPLKKDENPPSYYSPDDEWKVYEEAEWWVKSNRVYKKAEQIDETEARVTWYTDPDFKEGTEYSPDIYGEPVQQPMIQYDFSDYSKIISTKSNASFVTTDSCALRLELNTGRQDRIVGITSACEKIIVCTTTSEWLMPESLSAISNQTVSPYQNFGSIGVPPVVINGSMVFLQRSNILREFFLYEGYMNNSDLTSLNREILEGEVVEIVAKNTPTPCIYAVMATGEMRVLTYDKEIGIQAWSRWIAADDTRIISTSVIENEGKDILVALVQKKDGTQILCSFDEDEKQHFVDFGDKEYETELETTYAEIIDNNLVFGRFKRAKKAWIRPYNTGRIQMGNDERQMKISSNALGSSDYEHTLMGSSQRQFSMKIKSYSDNPMNILALSWEAD